MSRRQIDIPEPCQENWHAMTATEQGRFCDRCQHAVVDFTRMSDREVVAYIEKAVGGRVCGRIQASRLEEPLIVPETNSHLFWQAIAAGFGLTVLFGTGAAMAQGKARVRHHPVQAQYKAPVATYPEMELITGTVTEKGTKLPLESVVVMATVLRGAEVVQVNGITDHIGQYYIRLQPGDRVQEVQFKKEQFLSVRVEPKTDDRIDVGMAMPVSTAGSAVLEGKVVDAATGDALVGANVIAYRNNNNLVAGSVVDIDGNYRLEIPDVSVVDRVRVAYVGYETKEFTGPISGLEREIKLVEAERTLGGAVVIVSGYEKPSLGRRIVTFPGRMFRRVKRSFQSNEDSK